MYLTRNQAYRKVTGVRIPPSPPLPPYESSHPLRWLFCWLFGAGRVSTLTRTVHTTRKQMTDSIDSPSALRRIYAAAKGRSVAKQIDHLDAHCKRFIALSPFVVLASANAQGDPDASPRGGAPGFVHVVDEHTLLIPDSPGNNRLDSLSNLAETGKIGLLFMIPGVDETLRVNGQARLAADQATLLPFAADARIRLAIEVAVVDAYLRCAKALMRSKLWNSEHQVDRSVLPSVGEMLADQTATPALPEIREQMLARYACDL